MIAETHRAPFDFAEGESELVSGFNVEYGAVGFALLFMAEYGNILFISFLCGVIFFGGGFMYLFMGISICVVVGLLRFLFIWVRASYPRYRYDLLIYLIWKRYLPCVLIILGFITIFRKLMFFI